jgi:hypothetical protein
MKKAAKKGVIAAVKRAARPKAVKTAISTAKERLASRIDQLIDAEMSKQPPDKLKKATLQPDPKPGTTDLGSPRIDQAPQIEKEADCWGQQGQNPILEGQDLAYEEV